MKLISHLCTLLHWKTSNVRIFLSFHLNGNYTNPKLSAQQSMLENALLWKDISIRLSTKCSLRKGYCHPRKEGSQLGHFLCHQHKRAQGWVAGGNYPSNSLHFWFFLG